MGILIKNYRINSTDNSTTVHTTRNVAAEAAAKRASKRIVRLPPKAPAVHSRIGSAVIPKEGDPYMFENPRNHMQLWLLRGCRIHGLKEVLKVILLRVRVCCTCLRQAWQEEPLETKYSGACEEVESGTRFGVLLHQGEPEVLKRGRSIQNPKAEMDRNALSPSGPRLQQAAYKFGSLTLNPSDPNATNPRT